jgi:hypothetical protein
LVTSVRGIGELPTTAARSLLGCIGFMNAAFGVRFLPEDFRRLLFRPPFFAAFLDDFLAEDFRDEDFFLPLLFFFAAIVSPCLVIGCEWYRVKRGPSETQTIVP